MYVFNGGFRVVPVSVAVFSFLPLPALGHTDRAGVGQGCLVLSARLAGDSLWILPLAVGSAFFTASQAPASAPSHSWLPVSASSNQTSIIKFMRDELPA